MSKLRAVIRHEYLTIIRQPSFWLSMIAIPLIIALVIGLNYFSAKTGQDRIEEISNDLKNVTIIDKSGLINRDIVEQNELQLAPESQFETIREQVRTGETQGLVVFPEDLATSANYQIYINSPDLTMSGAVGSLADGLLRTSLFLPLGDPEIIALAQNGAQNDVTFYRDGVETAGINEYIVPGLFVVLFYIIFAFSVSYMLTSISEEKENRSMEMVLTHVQPRTLILGKLLGVSLVTLTQLAFFAVLAIAGFLIAQNAGSVALPMGIDLSKAVFNPASIILGFGYLVTGFLMYAGFMTTVAAIAPSAKEANNFSSVFIIAGIVPFWLISAVVNTPDSAITTFITYFPLTSPVTSLIRNTVGNMDPFTAWTSLLVMTIFMVISIWIAIRAFRLGALEFAQTVKVSKILKKS